MLDLLLKEEGGGQPGTKEIRKAMTVSFIAYVVCDYCPIREVADSRPYSRDFHTGYGVFSNVIH